MTTTADQKASSKPKATKKTTTTKRKTSAPVSRKKTTSADHGAAAPNTTKSSAATTATPQQSLGAPTHILIVDNGGDTLKYGWSTDVTPSVLSNVTARLQQQWTVLAADQLATIQNPNQLIGVTRSTERGIIVNFGNQIQVWKRMLDLLGITLASLTTDTAQAFGWKQGGRGGATEAADKQTKIPAATCAVLLTVPPHCPRMILDQIMLIWMEDFGFSHVGFTTAQVAAAALSPPVVVPPPATKTIPAACIVDIGWSACTVVPTYRQKAIHPTAIRRLPLGGRHLINMSKYYFSYRQWNLMDQEWILRQVLEKTGYVSLEFAKEMQLARQWPAGRRPFDREFLLPDYQTSFEGEVQLPPSLLRAEEEEEEEEDQDDDDDDEDVREEDMNEEDIELDLNEEIEEPKDEEDQKEKKKSRRKSKKGSSRNRRKNNRDDDGEDDEEEDDDDEEDDQEALRKSLLKLREEEEQRRQAQEAERQSLRLSVERFTIPEVLFRPSDGGLPREWAGLAGTVVQAIDKCPEHFRAALYRNVRLVGGLAQLSNLKERLTRELRSLAPCDYKLQVTISETPQEDVWQGAKTIATTLPHMEWSISKEEWTPRGSWKRLTQAEGGALA
eukprot:scaffold2518_cov178-Amphora_coffeaeformis.AAC.18